MPPLPRCCSSNRIALEMFAFVWFGHLLGEVSHMPSSFWEGFWGSATLLAFVVFGVAAVIATIPFLLFNPIYKSLRARDARNFALLFGVLVAWLGLELFFGTMPKTTLLDHLAFVGMSLAPGLLSGGVFHQAMLRSRTPAGVAP